MGEFWCALDKSRACARRRSRSETSSAADISNSTLHTLLDAQPLAPNILSADHWARIRHGELFAPSSRPQWALLLRRTFRVDVQTCPHYKRATEEAAATLRAGLLPEGFGSLNVLFARQLAKEVPEGVLSFAVHPGVIPTPLSRTMGLGGYLLRFLGRPFMKTVEQGAATTIYAATSPDLVRRSGAYLADCAIAQTSDDTLAERLWKTTEVRP